MEHEKIHTVSKENLQDFLYDNEINYDDNEINHSVYIIDRIPDFINNCWNYTSIKYEDLIDFYQNKNDSDVDVIIQSYDNLKAFLKYYNNLWDI